MACDRRLRWPDRFDDEGRLRGGGERGADVERRTVFSVVVNEEGLLRVGTFDGEAAEIVGGETIGGIDFYFAAAEAVGHFERGEIDGGASVDGDHDRFGGRGFAVDNERHGALRGGSTVARDDGLHVDGLGIFAPDLAGGIHGFDGPVRLGFRDHGVGISLTLAGRAMSENVAARSPRCMSLKR